MSTRSPHRAVPSLALTLAAAIVSLLSGCGEALPSTPSPSAWVHQGTSLPPLVVQYCIDVTTSYYPSPDFATANTVLAQAILQRASGAGQAGATIFVTTINSRTYDETSTAKVITIPATQPQATFDPSQSQGNMFQAATPTAIAHEAQATVTADQAQVQQQIQKATAAAQAAHTFLQSFSPQPDNIATDVNGCVALAHDRFAHAPQGAEKVLLIASDLQDNVTGHPVSYAISGAKVLVINFKCDVAAQCIAGTQPTWKAALQKDGASSVDFYDPADTQAKYASGGLFS